MFDTTVFGYVLNGLCVMVVVGMTYVLIQVLKGDGDAEEIDTDWR